MMEMDQGHEREQQGGSDPNCTNETKKQIFEICYSELEAEHSTFVWHINDFATVCAATDKSQSLRQTSFNPSENIEYCNCLLDLDFVQTPTFKRAHSSWRMYIDKSEDTNSLGVYLLLEEIDGLDSDELKALMKTTFSIIDEHGNVLYTKQSSDQIILVSVGQKCGDPNFISIPRLLSTEGNYINGNILRLKLDMTLLFNMREEVQMVDNPDKVMVPDRFRPKFKQVSWDENACAILTRLWISKAFSDVVIECDGIKISAHKNILYGASKVFEAMFSHQMIEATSNHVNITDLDVCTLNEMLLYIYTGQISATCTQGFESLQSLLNAAEKYQLLHLKNACWDYLSNQFLSTNHIVKLLALVNHFTPTDDTKRDIYRFCARHWETLRNREDMKQLASECPAALIPVLMLLGGGGVHGIL